MVTIFRISHFLHKFITMFALTAHLMKAAYLYQLAALAQFQNRIQTKSIGLPYLVYVHKVAKEANLYLWC